MPARDQIDPASTAPRPCQAETGGAPPPTVARETAEPLRILIISTPKTGNTWLKLILAEIYGLPVVDLPDNPRTIDIAALPRAWIAQQHYWFDVSTRDWLEQNGVVVLTTVRHPADVFVSLWHHVRQQPGDAVADARHSASLKRDGHGMGDAALAFATQGFYRDLHISVSWLRAGQSLAVRYEDLWSKPMATLKQVTGFVRPCTRLAICRAISLCQIARLQKANVDRGSGFFRKGGIGGWTRDLPDNIRSVLREAAPYPEQLAFLGYSMNPDQYPTAASLAADYSDDPFGGFDCFENGVSISPVIIRCYFDALVSGKHGWPNPRTTGPGGYFDWLISPATEDARSASAPLITELAAYLYHQRSDVQREFPDPFGADRLAFANWFTSSAADEYQLDHRLVVPVFRSWAESTPAPFLAPR